MIFSSLPSLGESQHQAVMHAVFDAQAEQTPDAIAVSHGTETLTYAQLRRRANRLSHSLRARGVGLGTHVGLCFERSLEAVTALVGILKAGGTYVPLDPGLPRARLAHLLDAAQVSVTVTRRSLLERLPPTPTFCLERELLPLGEESDPPPLADAGSPAYLQFTSGSTGQPKGVLVPHRAIHRLVVDANYVTLSPADRVLFASPLAFDASTFELWGALAHGARAVILSEEELLAPRRFAARIREEGITVAFLTVALFNQIAREVPEAFSTLSSLLVGGEACDPRTFREVLARGAPRHLLNVYGPTENTTFSTSHVVRSVSPGARSVPIGRAISGTRTHVLDGHLRPVPPGAEGELYVGGIGLALGYVNQPATTAERFIPNPFPEGAGTRLYKTGDRVRELPDGTLDFLGRVDQQIKLRGHRIEPAEVEAALLGHPALVETLVTVRESSSGDRQLVAHYAARSDATCGPSELRRFLEERLPPYMVPAAFIPLPELPRSSNGKLDRGALPAHVGSRPELQTPYVAPRTSTERALASLFSEQLGLAPIGIHDAFLELGGDSLCAARIATRIREAFGAELPLRQVLASGTVAELAERLGAGGGAWTPGAPPPLVSVGAGDPVPLSFAQQRLWFLHELAPTSTAYVLPIAFRLRGPLDRGALERSLMELIARHEALRTTFTLVEDRAVQVVGTEQPPALAFTQLPALSAPERERALRLLVRREVSVPFDLERGPLLRTRLVGLGAAEHVLLLIVHHIAADGWSLGVLMRELAVLHDAFVAGQPSPLPALPLKYTDYTLWQRAWLSGEDFARKLEHWRHELSGAPDVLSLPTDRPRPTTPTHRGEQVHFAIPPREVTALAKLGQSMDSTPFMVYLAAFALLLHRATRDDDLVVGSPLAGRPLRELEGLVGFFVNTLPLRIQLQGALTFRQLLQRVRERVLTAFSYQEVPFERLVEAVRPQRVPGRQPLFQVMFALQSPPPDIHTASGLELRFDELENGAAPFDLFLQLWERQEGVTASIVYASELFDASTVTRMGEDYLRLLAAIHAHPDAVLADLTQLGAPAQDAEASLREAESRILTSPLVEDCAVRLRQAEGGRVERVAYVATQDPSALARLGPELGLPPSLAPDAVVRLSALPLDAAGHVDEDALHKLEVLDTALGRRWEEALRAIPGVTDATTLVHASQPPLTMLHLSDLPSGAPVEPLPRASGVTAPAPTPSSSRRPALSDGGPLLGLEGEPRTLVEALLRTAAEHGQQGITYLEARGAPVFQSHADLLLEARTVLGGLRQRGLLPGSRAVLQLDSLREHFTAFWACVLGGITPVTVAIAPTYEASHGIAHKLLGAWRLLQSPVVIASEHLASPIRDFLAAQSAPAAPSVLSYDALRGGPPASDLHSGEPSDVVFLQLTSGSTGVPKCIQETHLGILRHIQASRDFNGYGAGDVTLNWLPVDHVVPLLTCHLKDVVLGLASVQVRTERVLEEPLLWLDLLEQYRVTRTWSPNFGFKLVSDALARTTDRRWDLSRVRHFMNAGEQVTLPVVRDFLERVQPFGVPPQAMQPAFGMAEVCTCMTYNNDFSLDTGVRWIAKASLGGALQAAPAGAPEAVPFIDLGPPVPGVQIRIASADGQVLPEGTIGRLQIKGEVVTPGYLSNEAANRESFVGEGWFNSGDLGFIEGGRLTLTGREKETIIIRGANFYCHELEDVAGSVPGVEPTFTAACASVDPRAGTEGLAVFFVPREDTLEARMGTAAAIRTALTTRLGVAPAQVVPLTKSEFPKTTSGKIQRTQLKRWLEEGRFAPRLKELDLAAGNDNTLPDWFFQRVWVRKEHAPLALHGAGRVVVFLDAGGLGARLAEALRAAGRPCVCVETGPSFVRQGPERYQLAPHEAASYRQLLEALVAEGEPIEAFVHLLAHEDAPEPTSVSELEQGLGLSTSSVLFLAQALDATMAGRPVRLLVVANWTQSVREQEPLSPHKAPVLGLLHTLSQEMPWLDCRHLDLAPEEASSGVRWVSRELAVASKDREVAYRDGARHVARLQKVEVTSAERRPSSFVTGGRYLLSGGLGGLGLLVARHLLERYRVHLLIVGRGSLAGQDGENTAARASAHRELVATAGAPERVLHEAVDVAELPALRDAVARAEARWGAPLDGVLHLAGVLGERLLAEETGASFAATLRPKVAGAFSLARIASERPGTLFLGFSSVNATFGGFLAGAYAAGNRFLEHLALSLHRQGLQGRCLSWSLWEEVGMSRGHAMKASAEARGYLAISPSRGLASLQAALALSAPHLIVGVDARSRHVATVLSGTPQPPERLHVLYTGEPLARVPRVRDRFGTESTALPTWSRELPRTSSGSIDRAQLLARVDGRSARTRERVEPRTATERTLSALWRDVLGRQDIGALDNFFDLGGHSLLIAQLRVRLQKAFGREVPLVELFRHPTIAALATYLGEAPSSAPTPQPVLRAPEARARTNAIAVIGMACRVPGASEPDTFWANLVAGTESIRVLDAEALVAAGVDPAQLDNPRYVRARGVLEGVDQFDAGLFGMSPREAELTDPQHRLFLECSWEALDRAGAVATAPGGRTGIFAGAGPDGYLLHHLHPNRALLDSLGALPAQLGNERDYLATRVAYKLDLRGPALTVQTACSTSLVAVHLACRSLRDRECDLALAGGVSITFPLNHGHLHQPGHVLSPDGHCRAFDAAAGGTVGGDGVGVVVLKRLEDALADRDPIEAVILGSAVNNDGAAKVGFTAPGVDGQAAVISAAHAAADVRSSSISYVEAHGTGTALGDPLEIAALTQAFKAGEPRVDRCAVGSVKTNVGHLNTAAGIAGLLKTTLALKHHTLPPSLHFTTPNPEIAFEGSPFYVAASPTPWARGEAPRRAGVSAFGFGGTNAHLVLEEAPELAHEPSSRPHALLVLSARSPAGLETAAHRLAEHLTRHTGIELADVAHTLSLHRKPFPYRRALVRGGTAEALHAASLGTGDVGVASAPRGVAFLFPGQGAQHAGMTRELYRTEPAFRRELDRCAELFAPHLGLSLLDVLYGEAAGAEETRTALVQPALFSVEYALARLWMDWGVRPSAMLGHSLGEYVAACLAGVFSLEDAVTLVAARGRLMQSLPTGAMLTVPLGEEALRPLLSPPLALAAVNGPHACVVSGPEEALAALEHGLGLRGLQGRRLRTSHAFHSAMMDPILDAFRGHLRSVTLHPPAIPYLSNATGTWVTAEQATDPEAWVRQLRHTVRFHEGLDALMRTRHALLEVGPGRSLSALATALAEAHPAEEPPVVAWSLPGARGREPETATLMTALGRLWVSGVTVDWARHYAHERRRKVTLPATPFERKRYWIDPPHLPSPPPALARTGDEVHALDEAEVRIRERLAIRPIDDHPGLVPQLEQLCTSYLWHYLQGRGAPLRKGAVLSFAELKRRLGTVPQLDRLFEALIDLLIEDRLVARSGEEVRILAEGNALPPPETLRARLQERHPGFEGIYRFLDHCARHYPKAFTGQEEAISVLYPGGSSEFIADCERHTVTHRSERVYLELLAEALGRLARASPGRKLRILEVGGGRGLLTFPLLAALQGTGVTYHFTDVGKVFVDDARAEAERLGLSDRMTFGLLDISRDPRAQGYEPRSFDIVVAFNVVHATRDVTEALRHLRTLLVPQGTLALVEMVRTRRWDTLTWGLAEGWWYYDDAHRQGSPLLGLGAWESLLSGEGFERVTAWPRTGEARVRSDHGLVLALRGPSAEATPPETGPRAAPPSRERREALSPASHPRPRLSQPYVAPRTETERRLALICQELLGLEQVGIHDDFFELGADSLITLRITERIRQAFGREVPQTAAFRGATVERMALALDGTPDAQPSRVLVPLQSGGSRPPLFFVHPAAGVVFPFVELARKLGPEQPFYGLQAAGLDGQGEPDERIEDMATRYVAAIRTVAPKGPYHLGGFSFGCFVAYEMARQLRRAGEQVALLALIDEPAPLSGHRPTPLIMARLLATGLARSFWPHVHDYLYLLYNARERGLAGAARGGGAAAAFRELLHLRPDGSLLESFLARSTMANYIPRDSRLLALQQPAMLPMFRLFMLHLSETVRYRPGPYDGRVTLFKCTPLGGLNARDATFGWGKLAARVDVYDVPGEHLSVLRHPHVQVLAERMREALDAARRGAEREAVTPPR